MFRLNLWKTAGLLLVFVGLAILRFTREHELPPMARESILLRLKADYSRPALRQLSAAAPSSEQKLAGYAALQENQSVQIDRATVRGILWPKFVRVEVSVNGKPPPDNHPVRYFTLDALSGNAISEISDRKYYFDLW
jgi:hypothetical protein